MRVILYTGKGGVGKTSIAAATACRLAGEGKKVLIMSTDAAHSLRDSFEMPLANAPVSVRENLDGMEIDAVQESEEAWGNLRGYLKQILETRAEGGIETEELLAFPGLDELFSLFKILDIYEENKYDVLIVDCAPTGETLSLLKFPEMFGSLLKTFLPIERKAVKYAGPAIQKTMKIPMPKANVFDEMEMLLERLEKLLALMMDKAAVSLRIVTTPEKIVIKEAKRNFTYLHLYDYNVDAIIVNKVYPREATEGYFEKWKGMQEAGLQEIKESFRDIPIFYLELKKRELKGTDMLGEAGELYGAVNPAKVLADNWIFRMGSEKENPGLQIHLPFADKKDMELTQKNGELELSIKNEKRCFVLPDPLKGREITGAKLEDGILHITFHVEK